MTTMGATSTLLLVLATTSALFFDLAAARCKVMMFHPGHLDVHNTTIVLEAVVSEKVGDSNKLEVSFMKKLAWPYDDEKVQFLFGTKEKTKWYTAVEAQDTLLKDGAVKLDSDEDAGYFVAIKTGDDDEDITQSDWSTTAGDTLEVDFRSKGKPATIKWFAVVASSSLRGKICAALSVYINEPPMFRAGPMRYGSTDCKSSLKYEMYSAQEFKFTPTFIHGDAGNVRMFAGTGNYENAEAALNGYYSTTTAAIDGNKVVPTPPHKLENFYYLSAASDAKIVSGAEEDVSLMDQNLDVASLSFVLTYDQGLKKVINFQKFRHVNEGFSNGILKPMNSSTNVGGHVVFDGRDDEEVSIYDFKGAGNKKKGLTDVHIFYGLGPWAEAEAALSGHKTKGSDVGSDPKFFLARSTEGMEGGAGGEFDISSAGKNVIKAELSKSNKHKAHMVMWVAAHSIETNNLETHAYLQLQKP